jgi:hypothetical protein
VAVLAAAVPVIAEEGTVTVQVTPRPVSTFIPSKALGAGVDGLQKDDVARVYTPANVRAMGRVGYGPLTYRLRTELAGEAWHWNPQGQWSNAAGQNGYWTSDASTKASLTLSHGYRLPRRGSTTDQANNDGYSRLDDGDPRTFWKSNPYLDSHFTGEPGTRHPQWAVIDLGRARPVQMLRVQWADPYAVRYRVEYWVGPDTSDGDLDQTFDEGTRWQAFPHGLVTAGVGGDVSLRLCDRPIRARFVRLWLTQSSGTAPLGARDKRDGMGYAIREIGLGIAGASGLIHDWVRHAPRHSGQTEMYASSTDPWHRAADCDPQTEQPGFDRVFSSELTHRLPLLIPVGVLYDTPDNAAAEVRYLELRGYALRGVEMGEEPDGQFMTPEDYGALYLQWADALHRVDPLLKLGGPCFQTNVDAWTTWPDAQGDRSWMHRFLAYLKQHGHSSDFSFFSFEWYPFDNVCAPPAGQLMQEPTLLAHTMAQLAHDGLSQSLPCLMTEYGYSAFAGQVEVEMPGALLNAEIVAQFLTLGGSAAYLYGLEPNTPICELPECKTYGNLAVYLANDAGHIQAVLPAYSGEQMLTQEWAIPAGTQPHALYTASSSLRDAHGQPWVTGYPVHRPDGEWAVLLLNKDPKRGANIHLRFRDTQTGRIAALRGPVRIVQYSSAQYIWHANGLHGHPTRDLPPDVRVGVKATVTLPPYSLTVVRGSPGPFSSVAERKTP